MSKVPDVIPVVCMAVGKRYPDRNVAILESMLRRHLPQPFRLHCIVDRPRELPASVEVIDANDWNLRRQGLRVTTNKLGLFDPQCIPFAEFLYFDTTLVIQKDLTPLVEFAFASEAELVAVKDWNYDAYNTCVMRIRTGGDLQGIPTTFRSGKTYAQRNPGDQDYVTAYIRERKLESQVETWPKDFVASYRNARKLNRTNPEEAHALLERGLIVKFFGRTKMHQLLNPLYRLIKLREHPADRTFWIDELRERWR